MIRRRFLSHSYIYIFNFGAKNFCFQSITSSFIENSKGVFVLTVRPFARSFLPPFLPPPLPSPLLPWTILWSKKLSATRPATLPTKQRLTHSIGLIQTSTICVCIGGFVWVWIRMEKYRPKWKNQGVLSYSEPESNAIFLHLASRKKYLDRKCPTKNLTCPFSIFFK